MKHDLLALTRQHIAAIRSKPPERVIDGASRLNAAIRGGVAEYIVPISSIAAATDLAGNSPPTFEINGDGYSITIPEQGSTLGIGLFVSLWQDGAPIQFMSVGDTYVGRFDKVRVQRMESGGKYTPGSDYGDANIYNRPAYLRGQVRILVATQPEAVFTHVANGRNSPSVLQTTQGSTDGDGGWSFNNPTTGARGLDINGARGIRVLAYSTIDANAIDASRGPYVILAWRPPDVNGWSYGPGAVANGNWTNDYAAFEIASQTYQQFPGQFAPSIVPLGRHAYSHLGGFVFCTYDIPIHCAIGEIYPILNFVNQNGTEGDPVQVRAYAWR